MTYRRGVRAALVALGPGLGLAAWEGTVGRDGAVSEAGVLAAIVVAGAVGARSHRGEPLLPPRRSVTAGVLVWVVLAVATAGWDLYAFLRQRHDLPTLSRLCGDVTGHQWGRALFFALWLGLGAVLALWPRGRSTTGGR